jgi:hypothetical protein
VVQNLGRKICNESTTKKSKKSMLGEAESAESFAEGVDEEEEAVVFDKSLGAYDEGVVIMILSKSGTFLIEYHPSRRREKNSPKNELLTPPILTNSKLCNDPSRLLPTKAKVGCCCSHVIPYAPPHPDIPLCISVGKESMVTEYRP